MADGQTQEQNENIRRAAACLGSCCCGITCWYERLFELGIVSPQFRRNHPYETGSRATCDARQAAIELLALDPLSGPPDGRGRRKDCPECKSVLYGTLRGSCHIKLPN